MLEDRYIVLKKSDVARLSPKAQEALKEVCDKVSLARHVAGKAKLQAVVVEHDWPEYELTVRNVLKRDDEESYDSDPAFALLMVAGLVLAGLLYVGLMYQ